MHGHCHYDRVLSWSGAKQHSRRETPLLKSLHKIWCNAPRTCTRRQGVEQFFAPGAEWYPSLFDGHSADVPEFLARTGDAEVSQDKGPQIRVHVDALPLSKADDLAYSAILSV